MFLLTIGCDTESDGRYFFNSVISNNYRNRIVITNSAKENLSAPKSRPVPKGVKEGGNPFSPPIIIFVGIRPPQGSIIALK